MEQTDIFTKAEFDQLVKQNDYLISAIDKLSERFSGMGRTMIENNNKIAAKLDENIKPKLYTVKPNKSEQVGNLGLALANAKMEFTALGKTGSSNRGSYCNIDDIERAVLPALKKYELSYQFLVGLNEFGEYTITLVLIHSSGQFLETMALLNDHQAPTGTPFHQKIGASEKYLRRYMLRAMLCLGEESD